MTPTIDDEPTVFALEASLVAAFPSTVIDRAMIDEPTSNWMVYDDPEDLVSFEGKPWTTLEPALLLRHSTLPTWAGDTLWRTTLPAYLRYLLHERRNFTDLPFLLAGQLRHRGVASQDEKLERRIGTMSPQQRAVVRDVVAYLSTISPMEEPMSAALRTWNRL